jgi:hypothetical protein
MVHCNELKQGSLVGVLFVVVLRLLEKEAKCETEINYEYVIPIIMNYVYGFLFMA